jgi:hypothetical protein
MIPSGKWTTRRKVIDYTQEELDALKKEHAPDATDDQFKLWIAECRTRNAAPVRDIIMQVRTSEVYDPEIKARVKKKKSIYIVTIGFKRKIANATGLYAGQLPTKWIYLDTNNQPTVESEIPLPDPQNPQLPLEPWACRTSVLRKGFDAPLTVVSRFGAYCQTFKRNDEVQLTAIWSASGRSCEMLEKCGESAALTRAFPDELSGLYVKEELMKEDVLESIPVAAEAVVEAPKAATVPTVNHAPALPTNEPRPGEEKPRTKKNVKDVKIEEVILDKVEVVSGVEPEITVSVTVPAKALEPEPVQKMDASKPSSERCRDLITAGVQKDTLKAYILRVSGEKETKTVLPARWNEILTPLETLLSEKGKGAVNAFIAAKPEPVEDPF